MDSNVLERERGITIRAKHCTVTWKDTRINIVDTPGHADFSGEVERVLSMVDSVLLLVDAKEGPMPQTRYVLMRALKLGLRPIVIINKVDLKDANPHQALNETFDLFLELGADDRQADFAVLYGSGLDGWLVRDLDKDKHEGMQALFETIIAEVPPPKAVHDAPFRLGHLDPTLPLACPLDQEIRAHDELAGAAAVRIGEARPQEIQMVPGRAQRRVRSKPRCQHPRFCDRDVGTLREQAEVVLDCLGHCLVDGQRRPRRLSPRRGCKAKNENHLGCECRNCRSRWEPHGSEPPSRPHGDATSLKEPSDGSD